MGFFSDIGGALGTIGGGIAGFALSGGNPAGAAIGAGIGGSIFGGKAEQEAAREASAAQERAAQEAIQFQREAYNRQQQLFSPYVQAGQQALNQQLALLGLGGAGPVSATPGLTYEPVGPLAAAPQTPNTVSATPTLKLAGSAPTSGGGNYTEAWRKAIQGNKYVAPSRGPGPVLQAIGETVSPMVGQTALNVAAKPMAAQTPQDIYAQLEASPEYQALLQQGEEALLQNAAATGGLRGGNTQAALAQFRPQLLANLINQRFSRLQNITNLGQASAAGQAGFAGTQASNIGNLYGQIGAAQAGAALTPGIGQNIAQLGQIAGGYGIGSLFGGGGTSSASAIPAAGTGAIPTAGASVIPYEPSILSQPSF